MGGINGAENERDCHLSFQIANLKNNHQSLNQN